MCLHCVYTGAIQSLRDSAAFFLPPPYLSESSFGSLLVKDKQRALIQSVPVTSVFLTPPKGLAYNLSICLT